MKTPAFSLLILAAGVSFAVADGPLILPEDQRAVSPDGKYVYVFASVGDGKKFFSISSIAVEASGDATVYTGEKLLTLVDSATPSVTYALRKSPDDPASGVRGVGGKLKGQVGFRIPIPENVDEVQVTVTTFQDANTGVRLETGSGTASPEAEVDAEFVTDPGSTNTGKYRFSVKT